MVGLAVAFYVAGYGAVKVFSVFAKFAIPIALSRRK